MCFNPPLEAAALRPSRFFLCKSAIHGREHVFNLASSSWSVCGQPDTGTRSQKGVVQDLGGQRIYMYARQQPTPRRVRADHGLDAGDNSITQGRGRFRRRVVVGGELNMTLPAGLDGVTGSAVPTTRGFGTTSPQLAVKQICGLRLCLNLGLEAWAADGTTLESPGHAEAGCAMWHGPRGARRELDYILGEGCDCIKWGCMEAAFRSEHSVSWAVHAQRRPPVRFLPICRSECVA